MGDKTEQPGSSEYKASVIEPLDGDDVEGHRKFTEQTGDEPLDGDDVEGHRKFTEQTDDEPGSTESRGKRFTESDEDDVEGHKLYPL